MAAADDVQLSSVTSGTSNPLVKLLQHQTKVSRVCLGDDIASIIALKCISLMFTLSVVSTDASLSLIHSDYVASLGSGYRQGEGEENDEIQGGLRGPQSQTGNTA